MGPIGCPETSISNYQCTLLNIPEERRCQRFLLASFLPAPNFEASDEETGYVRRNRSSILVSVTERVPLLNSKTFSETCALTGSIDTNVPFNSLYKYPLTRERVMLNLPIITTKYLMHALLVLHCSPVNCNSTEAPYKNSFTYLRSCIV
jgi:hypothetical protein